MIKKIKEVAEKSDICFCHKDREVETERGNDIFRDYPKSRTCALRGNSSK